MEWSALLPSSFEKKAGALNCFLEARRTGNATVSDIYQSKANGKTIYVACAPIKSSSGDILGIYGMSIKAQAINEIVDEIEVGAPGYVLSGLQFFVDIMKVWDKS